MQTHSPVWRVVFPSHWPLLYFWPVDFWLGEWKYWTTRLFGGCLENVSTPLSKSFTGWLDKRSTAQCIKSNGGWSMTYERESQIGFSFFPQHPFLAVIGRSNCNIEPSQCNTQILNPPWSNPPLAPHPQAPTQLFFLPGERFGWTCEVACQQPEFDPR
jgi:hypothetical protein